MRSLETTITIAASIFALGMLVIASSPDHVLTIEPLLDRMEMLEAN